MTNESNENKIQPLVEKDIEHVCNIWLIGSLTSHGFIPAEFWYSRLHDIKKDLERKNEDKEHYEIYVYKEKDGTIKGFVIVRCKNSNGMIVKYMEELFIDLPYQKQRIGTQLLEYVRNDKAFLETDVYQLNTDAIIFYAKKGFNFRTIRLENGTGKWKIRMRWDKCKKEGLTSSC